MVKYQQTGVNAKEDRVLLILPNPLVDLQLARSRASY